MKNSRRNGLRIAEDLASSERAVVVIAGPNGAGKTTFVARSLQGLALPFINADIIASELWPGGSDHVAYEAAKIADGMRQNLISAGASFVMETVFSDRAGAKLSFLRKAQAAGYAIFLVFIGLESSEVSLARVFERTERGGHSVPEDRVIDRFPRTLENLREALEFVDSAYILDNSSADLPYRFVAQLKSGRVIRRGRYQPRWWTVMRRASRA